MPPLSANALLTAIRTAIELLANTIAETEMQVDVVSSALPAGASTEATVAAIQTAIELLDNAIAGTEMQVDVLTSALPAGASTSAHQVTAQTSLTAIKTAIELLDDLQGALKSIDSDELVCRITNSAGAEINPQEHVANRAAFASAGLFPAAAGTAEQGPDQAIPDGMRLVVRAHPGNTGNVWIGESKAQAEANNFTLQPNEALKLWVANSSAIWIDAAVNGEGVELIAEV